MAESLISARLGCRVIRDKDKIRKRDEDPEHSEGLDSFTRLPRELLFQVIDLFKWLLPVMFAAR